MAAGGPRASAVSFYPTDHPALNITVKSRLEKSRLECQQNLGSGLATDWADYQKRVGVIAGLTYAIDLCDEVLVEMNR